MLKIGSHVSMNGKDMMVGSVNEALSYEANTFMFYTGAPQNTFRKPISALRVEEAKELMKQHNINIDDVVVINELDTIKETPIVVAEPQATVNDAKVTKVDGTDPDSLSYIIKGTQTTYMVKQGETLTKISLRFYGTKNLWPYIVKHNKDIIKQPNNV